MLFEFSRHKIAFLFVLSLGLVIVTMGYFSLAASNESFLRLAGLQLERTQTELSYLMFYKFPAESSVALASAGLANAHLPATSTAALGPVAIAKSVPVLLYHGENEAATTTISTATFVNQMRTLKEHGWHTITMAQFLAFMKGTGTVPDKSFLLTFDDARKDAFYATDPVLRDLGFTAVMFVITGFSLPNNGNTPINQFYLSKAELAYMAKSGRWDLESHGQEDHRVYTVPTASSTAGHLTLIPGKHFLSNLFWLSDKNRIETPAEYAARVTQDLTNSRNTLESDFGVPVVGFAYPFNDFGQENVNYPEASSVLGRIIPSIYDLAFYQTWPGNGDSFNYPDPNTYLVKRIEPIESWSGKDLLAVLESGRAKPLPYQTSTFGRDWQTNWGLASTTASSTLALAAAPDTTGGAVFLNGTEGWTNYRIDLTADWRSGTVSLIARHTETAAPYLNCAFSQNRIYLERHTKDTQVTLAQTTYRPPALPTTAQLSMTVNGSLATCSAYGAQVSASVPNVSSHGGIGASVWDPGQGTARAVLENVAVHAL